MVYKLFPLQLTLSVGRFVFLIQMLGTILSLLKDNIGSRMGLVVAKRFPSTLTILQCHGFHACLCISRS